MILFIATTLPAERLPSLGFTDKLDHFIGYFILAFLVNLMLMYQRKSKFLFERAPFATVVICLFYGVVDELHQLFIPGRSAETWDWVADALGTLTGVLIVYILMNWLKYRLDFN